MTDEAEVERFADAVLTMLMEDQESGQVPGDVSSFDELDNYVDVDDYYRIAGLPSGDHEAAELRAAVGAEVGRRLLAGLGGSWHVFWQRPGGLAEEVGRTVGYASRDEAEAVGREHAHVHGGAFHLHRRASGAA